MATGEGLPEELRSWVEERAGQRGVDPEAVLARAVLIHREAERVADTERADDPSAVAARLDRLDDIDGEVAAVADRLDQLDDVVDELIEDVRERVIQVKRETDAKAPSDHDHPDLRETATEAAETAERALAAAETARDATDGEGLGEEVGDLRETTERLEARAETLARVAVDARDEIRRLRSAEEERAAADELRRTANRNGDTAAKCEDCGGTVDLGLLSRPRCPHCETALADVEPSGLIGKARLRTGTPPALEGETPADDPFEERDG
jgi:predicted Zn-ribbon and HTH transcriptional regulator